MKWMTGWVQNLGLVTKVIVGVGLLFQLYQYRFILNLNLLSIERDSISLVVKTNYLRFFSHTRNIYM